MDSLKEILFKVLDWIGQSPFRLLVILILSVFIMVGWVIYTEKDAYMATYRAQQALPKMNGNYEAATNFILKNTNAELVAIFEVNTLINSRKLAYMVTRGGSRIKDHDGAEVGLFTKNYDNNNDVVSLMSGKVPCSPYTRPQSFIGFVYKEHGINYMCRISVPSEPGVFIGQITVGWKEPPADVDEPQTSLTVASSMLYARKP